MGMLRARTIAVTATAALLAVPALAAASTRTTLLRFHHGHAAADVTFRLRHASSLEVDLRISNVRFPGAQFRVMLRRDDGTDTFHTLFVTRSWCQGAAGSIICLYPIRSRPAGPYRIRVRKLTVPGADAELRLSIPRPTS